MENSNNEELSTFHLLVKVAKADGDVSYEELDFIYRIAARLKISKEARDKVLSDQYSFNPPKEEGKRIVIFHKLLLLAYSDNKIDKKEIQVCHNLGLKLGLNTTVVSEILKILEKDPEAAIDPKRILKMFNSFRS